MLYENNKIFVHLKWNSKYADKTNEEGMQQIFWPILAWHRIANISRTRTTGSWIETKIERRRSSTTPSKTKIHPGMKS